MKTYSYVNENGEFDYERYRRIQIEGNKRKLQCQWASEESIEFLSNYIFGVIGRPKFGLCHGTRRGAEQMWFRKYLDCEVIGTEISDTAERFPFTIQWDFHETKPEWIGAVDFIYSNSWDHSYDPVRLFKAWMSCLRSNGLCILEHTPNQTSVNELDPLGLELDELSQLINDLGRPEWGVREILVGGPIVGLEGMKERANYVVAERF